MKIQLSSGSWVLIDSEDASLVNQYNWRVHRPRKSRIYYAQADIVGANGRRTTVLMHRLIAGFPPFRLDHRNLNGLDNRKRNLRRATRSENAANKSKPINNTSGYKGVSWHKPANKWRAYIKINQKWKHLGLFSTAKAAAKSYNHAARRWFGEFSFTNK